MRRFIFAAAGLLFLQACAPVYWLGTKLYYDKVAIPPDRITTDIGYDPSAPDDPKRQLDIYVPAGRDWPSVVFIHGGGWAWGDRKQKFGGADVYGNIGRFLAAQGYGAVIPSYRLIWPLDWRTQVTDVARAVAWAQHNIAARGGDPRKLFLMGHSAGAQLAMRVATDAKWLQQVGGAPDQICGVIAVSGAGYDLEDRVTEQLDRDTRYYVQRFGGSIKEVAGKPETMAWRREANVVTAIDSSDPPFLVMRAENDYPSLQRQNRIAYNYLESRGLSRGFVIVPGVSHERIVLELSRPDHVAGPAILKFLHDTPCPRQEAR